LSAKVAFDFNLAHWSDIQDHLQRLKEAAKGDCLEIGVRAGLSTSALLSGIEDKGGHLWSMDVNDCNVFSGHPKWTFIQCSSLVLQPANEGLCGNYEVVFIDGDHSYEGALLDLALWGSRGKRIFVHDTDAPDYPDVRRAVEFYVKVSGRKVTYHAGSFGMAEIQ
jgi:hypothetical protein